jgi:hypothetical protein
VYDLGSSNEVRAAAVENFLLEEAVQAGVVRKIQISSPKNPNKWGKTLAPWFTDACRNAKREMHQAIRLHGRDNIRTTTASKAYLKICLQARLEFAAATPDMLKY